MMHEEGDMIDLMVSIMRNRRAPTRVVELAAEVIAADARFNEKVGDAKTKKEFGDKIFQILDFGEEVMNGCRDIRDKFGDGLDAKSVCAMLVDMRNKIDTYSGTLIV